MRHTGSMTASHLTIRPASERDMWAVDQLAALDSQRPLTGDVLLAEDDGRPVAAVAMADGRIAADPFVPTASTVELLRTRAHQMRRPATARPGARRAAHRFSLQG